MNITVVISDTKLRVNNMYINTLEQCMHAHTDTHASTHTHTKDHTWIDYIEKPLVYPSIRISGRHLYSLLPLCGN